MTVERTFFGTDGIRGKANHGHMTADIALKVGMAAGSLFTRGAHRHSVVIGKDTRLSGYLLEPALVSGFISVGMDVILVGPMPTPAVAMLTRSLRADMGVMISASHNPYDDNGIKLFGPDGYKLSDETEMAIEQRMQEDNVQQYRADSADLGKAKRLDDAPGRYIEYVKHTLPRGMRFAGLKVVIDCAHGAAYHLGKTILWELGANVTAIGVEPDGLNINEQCGSTYPETLANAVREQGADIGIALDGDADRVTIVDEKGQVIDGENLLAAIVHYWQQKGQLKGDGVAVTQMSNLGLEQYFKTLSLKTVRTRVGDRYVTHAMREHGYNIGGEPSGHIILGDYATTGDGLVAALQVIRMMVETEKPVSELCSVFKPFPQIMRNVTCSRAPHLLQERKVQALIHDAEQELAPNGRLLVRKSGTEPLIRIMAEGQDQQTIHNVVDSIADEMTEMTKEMS